MPARAFFDTNILLYAFVSDDARKQISADLVLSGGMVGVQTLNEFVSVARAKSKTPWRQIEQWLQAVQTLCPGPVPVTLGVYHNGVQIAQTYGYHIYDALMLAAALEAQCTVFYSEDLQDGQEIAGMTIQNPFRN
jgi:predicted nucleic acid-binding protein